jgi:hypothetical protein
MSNVTKARKRLEAALLGEVRTDAKWREIIREVVVDLTREASIQKTPGTKRNQEQILRDKIKIISTSVADPSLNYQMILQYSGVSNINIARVSETLTRAIDRHGTLLTALAVYKAEYNKKYPRLGPL